MWVYMESLIEFIKTIIGQFPGFIFGVAATLFITAGTGFIKEFFDERARKRKHELEVARHVLGICNEASTGNFREPPREMEHINSTLTDLEGINEEMSVKMTEFVSSWRTFSRERSNGDLSPDNVKFAKGELDRAEKNRKILITWANKIRVGSSNN